MRSPRWELVGFLRPLLSRVCGVTWALCIGANANVATAYGGLNVCCHGRRNGVEWDTEEWRG